MYKEIKNLAKHGSIYTLGIILGRIVSFVMIPVYTNYLTPADYGLLQMLTLTIDVISTLFGLGMGSAVLRSYQSAETPDEKRTVMSSALLGSISLMGIVAAVCIVLSPSLSNLIFGKDDNSFYFQIMFLSMFFAGGIELPMIFLRANLRSVKFVTISMIKLAVQLGLNILFLVVMGMGVKGIMYSSLISSAGFALYLTVSMFGEVGIKFAKAKYREMLVFGAPLIISDLSVFALTYADRYFLNYMADLAVVGIYSMSYTFGMILSVLVNGPFMAVWGTEMFRYGKQPDGKAIFAKVLLYYLLVSLTISLGLTLLTKDVLRIMADEQYWSAYKYVPFISLSYVLNGVIYIAGGGILISGKTKYRALSTFMAMVFNLVLNFLLIPSMGAYGAAIATIAAFVMRLVIDVYYSQKLFPISYDIKRCVLISAIYLAVMLPGFFVMIENVVLSVAFHLGVIALFPLLCYFTGVLTSDEKAWVNGMIRNPAAALKSLKGQG